MDITFSTGAIILTGIVGIIALILGVLIGTGNFRGGATTSRSLLKRGRRAAEESIESDRMWGVFEMIIQLTETLNYQRVLDLTLDISGRALAQVGVPVRSLNGAVFLFSENGASSPVLRVVVSRGFTRADQGVELPGMKGFIKYTIEEGSAQKTTKIKSDPELQRIFALQSAGAVYAYPLRSGLDNYGLILFAHPSEDFFSPEVCEILGFVGNQAMIALKNARLYQDLAAEKERMIEVHEEARKNLARNLHDGPTQSISAIAMRAGFIKRNMDRDPRIAVEELDKIEESARKTTNEIRHMLFTLRPLILESEGLIAALDSMAEKMKETFDQTMLVDVDPEVVEQIEMAKQGMIFSITDEAVNNARKHAKAVHIWVRLHFYKQEYAMLVIEDDGKGFNVSETITNYEHRGSLGMINMQERAELVNGVLNIDSTPGKGTRIQVMIPLTDNALDALQLR